MPRVVTLPAKQVCTMKLVLGPAATATAFVGPTARLPAGRGSCDKVQQQPAAGRPPRARANNLVSTRRPRRSRGRLKLLPLRLLPRSGAEADVTRNGHSLTPSTRPARIGLTARSSQVATKAEAAEVADGEEGHVRRPRHPPAGLLLLLVPATTTTTSRTRRPLRRWAVP